MKRLILPSLAVIAVLAIGIWASGYYGLYRKYEYFDTVMHLVGSTTLAWLLSTLATKQQSALTYRSYALFIAGIVLIFGVIWEAAEYLSGANLKGTIIYDYYRGGDLQDTIADLIADLTGAMVYMLAYLVGNRKS